MILPIFVNPLSRQHKKNPQLADEYSRCGDGHVEILRPSTFKELAEAAELCKKKKYPCVAISGGDGTIHQVVTALFRAYKAQPLPKILLLGDGTMNNIANSVGIKKGGKKIISRYLDKKNRSVTQKRSTIKIEDRYCFLFGCGLVSNFLVEVYKGEKGILRNLATIRLGVYEAIKSLFITNPDSFKLLKPLNAQVYVSGKQLPIDKIVVLLAGTVEKIGMGFRPLSKAKSSKKSFHLLLSGAPATVILINILPIALGKGLLFTDRRYIDRLVPGFEIHSQKQFEYTMDGDMYLCNGKLKIQTGPEVQFVIV
jgi:diacylglycerol kinase family enzyme